MGSDASEAGLPRAAWAALGVGAVLRVVRWIMLWNRDLLLNDSWYYSGQARQLAQGIWFRELFHDHPGAEHGPLTSLLMAPVSFGSHYQNWQRLVTVACGVALVWAIARFVAEVAGPTACAVAAWVAALYPNLWMNDGLVMSESLSVLLVTLSMWCAWRVMRSPSTRSLVILGFCLGLSVLARSELALFVPLVVAWLVWRRAATGLPWRPALLALGVAVAVVAPWVGFNMARFERPVLLTTNDGTTLLGANCPSTYSGSTLGGWTIDCVSGRPDYDPAEEPSVRSARQRSQAISFVAHHLGDVPKVVTARMLRTFDLYGVGDLVKQDVGEERPRWAVWSGIVMFWLLVPMAGIGVRLAARHVRWLLLAPVVSVLATTVLFYGAHRIRSSAEPTIVVLAATAAVHIIGRRRPEVCA